MEIHKLVKELEDKFAKMQNLFLEMSILISKIEIALLIDESDKEKHA